MLPVFNITLVAILSCLVFASDWISGCGKECDVTSLVQIKKNVVFGSDRPDVPFSTDRKGPEQPKPPSAAAQALLVGQQSILPAAPRRPPQVQQLTILPVQQAQAVQQAQQVQQLTIQPQALQLSPEVKQQAPNPQMQQPMILMRPVAQVQPKTMPTLSKKAQEDAAYLQWKKVKDAENAALFGNSATSSISELSALNVTALANKRAYETAAAHQWQSQKDKQDKLLYKVLQAKKMAEDKVAMKLWQAQKADEASQLASLLPDASSGSAPQGDSVAMSELPQMQVAPPPDDPSLASMGVPGQPQPYGSILVPLGQGAQAQAESTDTSLAAVVPGSSEMLGPTVANLTPIITEATVPVIPPALTQGQPYGNFATQNLPPSNFAPDVPPSSQGQPDAGFASAPPGDPQGQPAMSERDRQAAVLMGVMPGAMMPGAPLAQPAPNTANDK